MRPNRQPRPGRLSWALRWPVRRLVRWYAIACARDDARRMGFVVPARLPHPAELRGW